jgi:hypothetical protein
MAGCCTTVRLYEYVVLRNERGARSTQPQAALAAARRAPPCSEQRGTTTLPALLRESAHARALSYSQLSSEKSGAGTCSWHQLAAGTSWGQVCACLRGGGSPGARCAAVR